MRQLDTFAAIAVGLAALWTGPAPAQAILVPSNEKLSRTIVATGVLTGGDVTLYVVPVKRLFRLTDIIVSSGGPQVCDVLLVGKTNEITVPPRQTVSVNLTTGIAYGIGEPVIMRGNCGRVTITGVLTAEAP